ncbi:MAG: hypothetical protein ACHQVS_00640 [Candidatus Babeliales bacterium]
MEIKYQVTEGYVERDSAWIETARNMAKWRAARMEAEKQEKMYSDILKTLSHGAWSKGGGFVYDFIVRKGNVDYGRIPELRGVDLEPYRKESLEVWKLSMEMGE